MHFNNSIGFGQLPPQALQEAQIDQEVNERVLVRNGRAVAQMRPLNAQGDGLRVNAFDGGALAIDPLVQLAVTVEGVTQARADTGGHHGRAALLLGVVMMNGTALLSGGLLTKGTHILAAFMLDDASGAVGVGEFEVHG